jgi:hypothetical protein
MPNAKGEIGVWAVALPTELLCRSKTGLEPVTYGVITEIKDLGIA